jgi:hypothetical protein
MYIAISVIVGVLSTIGLFIMFIKLTDKDKKWKQ